VSGVVRDRVPEPGRIRPFAFPPLVRSVRANGMTLLTARHGTLPVVTAQVVVRAGAAADPAGREGLAHLATEGLDTGTPAHDGDALAWAFERLGVELVTAATWDDITLQVTMPASRLVDALVLLAEVARGAIFPSAEIERLRGEQLALILQNRKEPRALADDAFNRFTFAEDVRYARPLHGTRQTVSGLARDDVGTFHSSWFTPSAAALILAGDIDADRAAALVDRHFGDWTGRAAVPPAFDVKPRAARTEIHVVHRADAVQSEIRVGHPTVARGHPDHAPIQVMNTLLGGAFTSRLNLNLREKHGFTYGVRSGFGHRRNGGRFLIATAVATEVTAAAVEQILLELDRLHRDGAEEPEVANARDYLTGITPLQIQTAEQVADRLSDLFVYDLPDDHFDRFRDAVGRVTPDDLGRVAREHLHPHALAVVVAGNADAAEPALRALVAGPFERHTADDS
jgi:zinc protease